MKVLSEAELLKNGWIKEGDGKWHSPVRTLPEEITESSRRAAETKRRLDSQRPSPEAMRERLVESFMGMGMNRATAELAASNRRR